MTPPLVSVIIPCYKQAQYLPEAVESVLAQTYPHVETIVVNDGSPDDTEAVALRYGERIRYVWRPNGGISAARNTGITHSHGDYLKFLDSDDLLHPEQIARQMEALAGRDNAVSFTGCRLFRDGHPEQYLDHVPQARALLPDLFRGDIDWGSILCYLVPRRLVALAGGFVERIHYAEDWFFATQVGLFDPELKLDPRIGCYYRQRPGSASANRAGWVRAQAWLTLQLHGVLSVSGRPDWFGRELLEFEQGLYQGLVTQGIEERDLLDGMLRCIKELQKRLGTFGAFGWRFRLMTRVLGYARAERLRVLLVRALKIRPPETLDTNFVETGVMAEAPTVSVIVPAYRASGTIGRALDSLLAQTHPPDEIIVVDDGSPDDQAAAVARFGDRVRLLRKANGGATSARNHGIDHSTGELIAFLDADDYWSPGKLERQLAVLGQHPEVGLVAGEFQVETPGTTSWRPAHFFPPELADRVHRPAGAEVFRTATHVWTSTVLLRRSVLGQDRFDTSLRTAEDIDLWVRLLLKVPLYLISEPLATMVLVEGSLSRSDVARDFPNMLTVVRRHAALLGPRGVRCEEARVYRNWAASHLGAGEGRKALAPAWQRLVRQPWSPQAWWIVVKAAAWGCASWRGGKPSPREEQQ